MQICELTDFSHPPIIRAAIAANAPPALPNGKTCWDLLKLVECAGPEIGFSRPAIRLFSFLVRRTDPRDWEGTAPEPVCYLSQCAIADALRLDSRSVRRAERELIELGAIHKQSRGDGHRGCLRGSAGVLHVFGLNLAPLIAFYPNLEEAKRRREDELDALRVARLRLSQETGELRCLIGSMPDDHPAAKAVAAAEKVLLALPSRPSRISNPAVLQAALERALTAKSTLLKAFSSSDNAAAKSLACNAGRSKMSGAADKKVRRHTNYKEKDSVVESYKIDSPNVLRPVRRKESVGGPGRRTGGRSETRTVTPQPKPVLPAPSDLCHVATDEVRWLIERLPEADGSTSERSVIQAARMRIGDLGISHSAWEQAMDCLGPYAAAAAVVVLDRNQAHPAAPVRSPGGALRGITRKFSRGDPVNLEASVQGILARPASRRLQ